MSASSGRLLKSGWYYSTLYHVIGGIVWKVIAVIITALYGKPCRKTRRYPNAVLMLAQRLRRWPSIKSALSQRLIFADIDKPFTANMRRWPNVGLLLGQRRRRWANSKPTVGQRLMFA